MLLDLFVIVRKV